MTRRLLLGGLLSALLTVGNVGAQAQQSQYFGDAEDPLLALSAPPPGLPTPSFPKPGDEASSDKTSSEVLTELGFGSTTSGSATDGSTAAPGTDIGIPAIPGVTTDLFNKAEEFDGKDPTLPEPPARHLTRTKAPLCQSQAYQKDALTSYWSSTSAGAKSAGRLLPTPPGTGGAAESFAQTSATDQEWCSPIRPETLSVGNFMSRLWYALIVIVIGTFIFWLVRGFRLP